MQESARASVVYTLTMEDLIAANLFVIRHSTTIRRIQQLRLLTTSLTMFLCGLGVPWLTGLMPFWPSLLTGVACAVWTVGYCLYYYRRGYIKRVRKTVEKMYSEGEHPGLLGEHTLEVNAEGITHVSAYSRAHYAWGALDRIETEPGYTYLYMGTQIYGDAELYHSS